MYDQNSSHRRFNPLLNEWVLVSPHRWQRPWLGAIEALPPVEIPTYDPGCYLCPGNARVGGEKNPQYTGPFAFTNDFSALLPSQSTTNAFFANSTPVRTPNPPWLKAETATGLCRVVCFSPDHKHGLPNLDLVEIEAVLNLWGDEMQALRGRSDLHYAQIFENKGAMMGASNPHPHCQIWASNFVPLLVEKETASQETYLQQYGRGLLEDVLNFELKNKERLVWENAEFAVIVPFWAVWPFETMLLPKNPTPSFVDNLPSIARAWAEALQVLTRAYDRLFQCSFPYSAGIHQAPLSGGAYEYWHWHMHFLPPLLRSATVRKFMVGFELMAEPQRDIPPEVAADRLRQAIQPS